MQTRKAKLIVHKVQQLMRKNVKVMMMLMIIMSKK